MKKDKLERMLVFIDDSGDPGFKGLASSDFLVMAAVVFQNPEVAMGIDCNISNYRRKLGWKEWHEFKFNKTTKKVRLRFLRTAADYEFDIYAVYIDKNDHFSMSQFSGTKHLYDWVVKELLKSLPLNNAVIKIDGKYGENYKKYFRTYIRKNLNLSEKRVKSVVPQDSKENNLVQLADMIAGAINRYLQKGKNDSDDYFRIIQHKIIKLERLI